jgi:hypothetical protein
LTKPKNNSIFVFNIEVMMKDFPKILFAVAFLAAVSFAQAPAAAHNQAPAAAHAPEAAPAEAPAHHQPVAEPVEAQEPAPAAETAEPDSAAAAVETAPAPEPVAAPEPAPAPQPVAAPAPEPKKSEPMNISFKAGPRLGFGISAYRGHIALLTSDKSSHLKLEPALTFSVGAAFSIGFNELFSLAPELQYSLYRANSEVKLTDQNSKSEISDYLREVGVFTSALEIPILAHFSLPKRFYADFGPQIGFNLSSKIYKDEVYYRPDENLLAFGLAAGGGVDFDGLLLGVRGYFGFLEYSDKAKGIPWSVQLSLGAFIF